jgi:hypothetical protein
VTPARFFFDQGLQLAFARVTGLGEFSHFGRYFFFGNFCQNYIRGKICRLGFFLRKIWYKLTKYGLGYILGDFGGHWAIFFTKASGHLAFHMKGTAHWLVNHLLGCVALTDLAWVSLRSHCYENSLKILTTYIF